MATTARNIAPLAIDTERYGTTLVLRLAGELDMATATTLGRAAQPDGGTESVILDLESLEFVDSAGLRALYELTQVSRNAGFTLVMVGAQGHVRRVMGLTGLDEMLPLADDTPPI